MEQFTRRLYGNGRVVKVGELGGLSWIIWQIIIWEEIMVSYLSVSQYWPEENGEIHNNLNKDSR